MSGTLAALVNPSGVPVAQRIAGSFFVSVQTAASVVDQYLFIAPFACRLLRVENIFDVTNGAALTLTVRKCTGTQAPSAGTDLGNSSTFNLNATARTVQRLVLTSTVATLTFAEGDRLAVDFSTNVTSLAGNLVTAWFEPV